MRKQSRATVRTAIHVAAGMKQRRRLNSQCINQIRISGNQLLRINHRQWIQLKSTEALKMPDARQEIRTRASCECRHPAYEIRAGAKDREYSAVSLSSSLEATVYFPSTSSSRKQRG